MEKYRSGLSTNMSAMEEGSETSLSSWQKIDYDLLLTKLGEFGLFQKKALFWLWLPAFVGGIVSIFRNDFSQVIILHFSSPGGGDFSLFSARALL